LPYKLKSLLQAVTDRLKNHRNNVFIKRNREELIKNALGTEPGTRSQEAMVKATQALVAFQSTASPKERFRLAKDEAIRTLAWQKRSEKSTLNGAAAYQLALTEMWNEADQASYEAQVTDNIFQ
jgi:hypothetical protein